MNEADHRPVKFRAEHLGLAARDPARLKDWYVQVLHARVLFADGGQPPAYLLDLGQGWWLEIYTADQTRAETGDNKLGGWRHLALRVDSIEPARDELRLRGVTFEEPIKPAGGGGQVLFFRDLEGNLLHLVECPGDSPLCRSGAAA
jgi:catechol 2,3-dioxygenase-like lactoylglutathione lyase family enzyme